MKIVLLTFLTICFSNNLFAHKDKVVYEEYGNVKVYLRTGFEYSEIQKIKIIGKLSEKLSKHLNYKDTLLIEYIHDYTDSYKGDIYILENNASNPRLTVLVEGDNTGRNGNGFSVRVSSNNLNIESLLKLIEYSILNKESLNSKLIKRTFFDKYGNDITIDSNTSSFINQITTEKSSIINKITSERTYLQQNEHYGVDISWMDGKFKFEIKNYGRPKPFVEIPDYFYYVEITNGVLIFSDKNNFYILKDDDSMEKTLIHIEGGTYIPYSVDSRFANKLLIYNNHQTLNMYLINERKLINKFE